MKRARLSEHQFPVARRGDRESMLGAPGEADFACLRKNSSRTRHPMEDSANTVRFFEEHEGRDDGNGFN